MGKTHLLVDFENVHDVAFARVPADWQVKVFVGRTQNTIPFQVATEAQKLGNRFEWIKIGGDGHNNLDFHLAYYLGRLSAQHPGDGFLILSKDKGFDALLLHLEQIGVTCRRIAALPPPTSEKPSTPKPQAPKKPTPPPIAPAAKSATAASKPLANGKSATPAAASTSSLPKTTFIPPPDLPGRIAWAVTRLQQSPKNRPARRQSLVTYLRHIFYQQLSSLQIVEVASALEQHGYIIEQENTLTYRL